MAVILIVDDDSNDIKEIQSKFAGTSFSVAGIRSYGDMARSLESPPDLIILDQYFTMTKEDSDYLGRDAKGNLRIKKGSELDPEEKTCQGFLILEKLRKDKVQIPTLLLSAHEQNWEQAYRLGACHLLAKNEMLQRHSDFFIKIVQGIIANPQVFLRDSFSYNGILCDSKLKDLLEEQHDKWRNSWKMLVKDFMDILRRNGIKEATTRHFYDFRRNLPYDQYRTPLSGDEIRRLLQDKFPQIEYQKEHYGYFLYRWENQGASTAVYVLRDRYCYDQKVLTNLKLPQANHPNEILITDTGYIPLTKNNSFSPNDVVVYFTTSWKIGQANITAGQMMDFREYCRQHYRQHHYRNLKASLDLLENRVHLPCIVPDNILLYPTSNNLQAYYLGFPIQEIWKKRRQSEDIPFYFTQNTDERYFRDCFAKKKGDAGCSLAYIHKFYLLYYWLKDRWARKKVIGNLARQGFRYFQDLFRDKTTIVDIFNKDTFYREDKAKKQLVFIYSAFSIGRYMIHHPVEIRDKEMIFDCELSGDSEADPAIRNIIFTEEVSLRTVSGNRLFFQECRFEKEFVLQKGNFQEVAFVGCEFDKITIVDCPDARLYFKRCKPAKNERNTLILKAAELFKAVELEECSITNVVAHNAIFREVFTLKQPASACTYGFYKSEFFEKFEVNFSHAKGNDGIRVKINHGTYMQGVEITANQENSHEVIFEEGVFFDNLSMLLNHLGKLALSKSVFHKVLELPFDRIGDVCIDFCDLRGGLRHREKESRAKAHDIRLSSNEIHRPLHLDRLKGIKKLEFEGNIFYFPVTVHNCNISEFVGPSIYREMADFSRSTFGKLLLALPDKNTPTFTGEVRFRNCIFEGESDFSKAIFEKRVDFRAAKFRVPPVFQKVEVGQVARFSGTIFPEDKEVAVDFSESNIKNLDLSDAVLNNSYPLLVHASVDAISMDHRLVKNLSQIRYHSRLLRKMKASGEDHALAGILVELKHFHKMFTELNDFGKADEIYVKLCEVEKLLGFKSFISYTFGKWTCNFGTDYWRPLLWMVMLTAGMAGYLWAAGLPLKAVPDLLSIFGGSCPDMNLYKPLDMLLMSVAVIGNLLLLNLFLVTLARKWIR